MRKKIVFPFFFFVFLLLDVPGIYAQVDLQDGLIAYYPFNGNPNDESGNERHGIATNGITLGADRAGNLASAYQFDGVDDVIELGNVFQDLALPFSFSVWIKIPIDAEPKLTAIFASNDGVTLYTGFFMSLNMDGTIAISYGDGGLPSPSSRRGIESEVAPAKDKWVHLAAVVRGNDDMSLYFDGLDVQGVLIGSSESATMVNGDYAAHIGLYDLGASASPWYGGMDDIRIYDRALSVEEVTALYEMEPDDMLPDPTVIITEIMKNPDDVADSAGEWFEIYNITDGVIDLAGWTIEDLVSESHLINQELLIQPHSTLVLCKSADRTLNGDVPCDYQYTTLSLNNKEDAILLIDNLEVEVDRVVYDDGLTFPSPAGASLYYIGGPMDDNNDGSNWEPSTERLPNYGNTDCPTCDDLGSPGTVDEDTLPVELVGFSVVLDGDAALLRWETASETNNAGFEIYHRTVNSSFEYIGWVSGAGTTTERRSYSFKSGELRPGRHFFRIKQIDFDGAYSWSREVSQTIGLQQEYLIQPPYPNPYNPSTALSFSVRKDQRIVVELVNLLGQRLATPFDDWAAANTEYRVNIPGDGLASGLYLVRVRGASFVETHQVYLVK